MCVGARVCVGRCASTSVSIFLLSPNPVRIQPEMERTLAFAPRLKGTCMGETFLLLSCGAAFITGIVIAAASLFG